MTAVGPAATPAITSGKLGRDGWYTSAVTVSWYWVDSLTINTAKCPGSTSTPDQGAAVVISGTCTDRSGNVGHSSVTVKIDTTPPVVTVTGVANGAVYVVGHVPSAGCTTTDAVSGVAADAILSVSGGRPGVASVHTATCHGAEDIAGNDSPPVSVRYSVVYGFGGFSAPKPGSSLKAKAPTITVRFRLVEANGQAVAASVASALAAHHDVKVTLRGPGISPATATCTWNASGRYLLCKLATPAQVKTGRKNQYLITATENLGAGFIAVPAVGHNENPEPVYFS